MVLHTLQLSCLCIWQGIELPIRVAPVIILYLKKDWSIKFSRLMREKQK